MSRNKIKIIYNCVACEKECTVPNGRKESAKFCSILCRASYNVGDKHWHWKGGVSIRTSSTRRAILAAKRLYKNCNRCGNDKNLCGHHIIPYSVRKDLAGDVNNIEILCSDCHALEHPEHANMIRIPRIRSGVYKNCLVCDKEFYARPYLKDKAKFCSANCQLSTLKKRNSTGVTLITKSCLVCSSEYKVAKYKKNISKTCSIICRCKLSAIRMKGNDNVKRSMDKKRRQA